MSKDEALEEWLEAHCGVGYDLPEIAAREAWHAAVKHTLAHVAGEVNKDADEMADDRDAELERGLAIRISKMNP